MAIPDSLLIMLKESYAEAAPVLFVLAIGYLVATIFAFYQYVLFGVEKLDEKATIPIWQLLKSDTFKAFTLSYIQSAITLPLAYYVLTTFISNKSTQYVQAALYIAAILVTTQLAMLIVLYLLVRRSIKVIVPWKSIGKYVLAGAIMGSVLYLIPHPTRIATILAVAIIGGIIYLTVLSVIDKEARALIKSILHEMRLH
jgi:magnesium-transporting ATPase (P-type)